MHLLLHLKHWQFFLAGQREGLLYRLNAIGADCKEFFQRVNICENTVVDWATPTQKSMADYLDAMSSNQRDAVKEIVRALLSNQVAEALRENEDNPIFGLRITNVLEKSSNEKNNLRAIYSKLQSAVDGCR